jgi:hypothetical protein
VADRVFHPVVPVGAAAAAARGEAAGSIAQTDDLGHFRLFGLASGEVDRRTVDLRCARD